MSILGKVENGTVILPPNANLPDGTQVEVIPFLQPGPDAHGAPATQRPTLAELFKDIIGAGKDLPPDLARNHDHYIHGTAKK